VARAVEVDGAKVRYSWWNPSDEHKPALMLVHGLFAHARWWDHIAPQLTSRYTVLAPDFTGMGDSDWRPEYSRRHYAEELIRVARDAGLAKVFLIAHSFGATPALYAALKYPDLVERVIVVDAKVWPNGEEPDIQDARPPRHYPDPATAKARFRLLPAPRQAAPAVLDYIAGHSVRRAPEGGWTWKSDPELFGKLLPEQPVDLFVGARLPVDLIYGGSSDIVRQAELRKIVENLPCCGEPVAVPLSGHHVMIEQPIGFVAALNGLLARPHGQHSGGSRW
jgi:pimeloyl-ACP methyl ester carboxylesterase